MTAQELATAFRNGQLRSVADDILCDGCRAIKLAVLLEPDELVRLRVLSSGVSPLSLNRPKVT